MELDKDFVLPTSGIGKSLASNLPIPAPAGRTHCFLLSYLDLENQLDKSETEMNQE